MPEGPELLTSRDQLRVKLLGQWITDVEVATTGRYAKQAVTGLEMLRDTLTWEHAVKIESIDVKGKFMFWTLQVVDPDSHLDFWMHCSYGMSGQWRVDEESKHPAITLLLSNGQRITFNDQRHFGTVKFVFDPDEHKKKLGEIGPDLFDVHVYTFVDQLRKHPKRTLPEVLMDQKVVSGCGNYIKAEALHGAMLSPHRTVESCTDEELELLFHKITVTMFDSYVSGGATIRTYTDPNGDPGKYAFELKVYGKKLDPDGNEVTREETLDGRTTWWVPSVQK
jgi:formamidopyrimidine-DNA glycosylase